MSDIEASVESKKGRGRLSKAAPKEIVEKIEEPREARKRGRPTSNEVTEKVPATAPIKDDNSDEGANGDVVKRGRGRPKKGTKFGGGRGRGRPPKTAKKDDDQDGDEES